MPQIAYGRIARQKIERLHVVGHRRAPSRGVARVVQADDERRQGRKIKVRIAPHQRFDGLKLMVFNLRDKFFVEQVEVGRHAETAVILVAARASGNLGQFRRCQVTVAAVKFARLVKGNMVNIHIEPHANGICGDQKIHLA